MAPLFCRVAGTAHTKIRLYLAPAKTQVGGIGQPIPSADLCRLFAYMGAYCIAHVKRSNLLLPCNRMDMILFEKLKAFFEERAETQLAQEQHKLERLENRKKFLE